MKLNKIEHLNKLCERSPLRSFFIFPITISRSEKFYGALNFVHTANRLLVSECAIILVWAEYSARLKFQNGGDDMATTSIAEKLAKLEKKIAKRQVTITEEQKQLDKEMEVYDKFYLTALD